MKKAIPKIATLLTLLLLAAPAFAGDLPQDPGQDPGQEDPKDPGQDDGKDGGQDQDDDAAMHKVKRAADAMEELMLLDHTSIPRDLLRAASCIANIHVVKGAFVVGIAGGSGLASCRDGAGRWSAPIFVKIGALSAGAQIGVNVVDLTLVFTNRNAIHSVAAHDFTLSAAAGLTVGPVGRNLSAGTDFELRDAVYTYSRSRGLFVGLALEGSVMEPYARYNSMVYGSRTPAQILSTSRGQSPATVRPYIDVLEKHSR